MKVAAWFVALAAFATYSLLAAVAPIVACALAMPLGLLMIAACGYLYVTDYREHSQ